MGRRKETTITTLKKRLWKIFSIYIRMRDCLETTGTVDHGLCCTCGRDYPIGKLQAGHFVPGRMDSILFEPTCVHAQCFRCNIKLGGNWVRYYRHMQKKYGQAQIDYLMALSEQLRLIDERWIKTTAAYYLEKIEEMEVVNV